MDNEFLDTAIQSLLNESKKYEPMAKKRKTKPLSEEKKKIAGLIKSEELLWDTGNKLHSNSNAVLTAWKKIALQMNITVPECKSLWKILKDAYRYKNKKISFKSGDGNDVDYADMEENEENDEVIDALSFLQPVAKRHPRSTTIFGIVDEVIPQEAVDVQSSSQASIMSNYSYASKPKKSGNESISTSVSKLSDTIVRFAELEESKSQKTTSKWSFLWENLENLFHKMSEEDADELNIQFINMAYEKVKNKKKNI